VRERINARAAKLSNDARNLWNQRPPDLSVPAVNNAVKATRANSVPNVIPVIPVIPAINVTNLVEPTELTALIGPTGLIEPAGTVEAADTVKLTRPLGQTEAISEPDQRHESKITLAVNSTPSTMRLTRAKSFECLPPAHVA